MKFKLHKCKTKQADIDMLKAAVEILKAEVEVIKTELNLYKTKCEHRENDYEFPKIGLPHIYASIRNSIPHIYDSIKYNPELSGPNSPGPNSPGPNSPGPELPAPRHSALCIHYDVKTSEI